MSDNNQKSETTPWDKRNRTCARAIYEQLQVSGLIGPGTLVCGNPGSGEELLYLEFTNEIQMGLAEPAVGSMIDGAGRVNSKPAVAIGHGFVGFSGLQGDVFNASQRQSPMLVIVGVSDSQAHTGETHMFADVEGAAKAARCKYVKNASDPATVIRDLRDSIVEAMTPPYGPVVFIVGSNVSASPNNETIFHPFLPDSRLAPPYEVIERLADQLLGAVHPGILIGDGISRNKANDEIVVFAELIGAEVWASMESEVNFPRNHSLFQGNLGHMNDSRGRELLKDLDYALAIGTPIYQTVFSSKRPLFAPNVGVAAINQSIEAMLKGHTDVNFPIKGDPKTVLQMLIKAINEKRSTEQESGIKERILQMEEKKSSNRAQRKTDLLSIPGVTMAKFAEKLEEQLSAMTERPVIFNEALVGAVGLTEFIRNVDMPGKYFDTSGGSLGEWAGGVGAAWICGPTLAFIGDGGFNYAPQVLWNAARNKLPVGFIVANNKKYGLLIANMDAALQQMNIVQRSIPHPHYYDLPEIDYVKIAEGYGVPGIRVDRENLIEEAVNRLTGFQGPFLVDLVLSD